MDSERWARVRSAFDELVELDDSARAKRLAALEADDPSLRREVEALLAGDSQAERRLARLTSFLRPTASERTPDPLRLRGATVAHFRVLEPLGTGGMGAVYTAEDTRLGRLVALKLPLPWLGEDSSARQRFLQEARSAGALDHPSLCSIYEVGETEDGQPWLAMALYRGETLKVRLAREGPLPVAEAVAIARRIAEGLAVAHEAGIVHRDLKPANVMLPEGGGVKVLDFGLAKVRDRSLTGTGALLGTAAYMSPEQVTGAPVDGRSDLWALGVVLYEMLTGRQPFRGEHDVAVAHAVVHESPARPSTLRAELPPSLEELVLGLLEKATERRPASARIVDAELESIERGRTRRRRRLRGTIPARTRAAAVAAVALGVAGLLAYRGLRPEPGRIERDVLAIAPFDVPDSSLSVWREGLMDILSLDLDGAGPLRTVPQTTVMGRWSGRSDRASAARLGDRTGAELVAFGHVARRGRDSVGIRVALLDRTRGTVDPGVEVIGEESRMGELADSLGLRILRTLGRSRAITLHRHQSIAARSLPALKEFLRGEQLYRSGRYDSAYMRYREALAADTGFVPAMRRLARVQAWLPAGTRPDVSFAELIERAVHRNHGLPPRESALIRADSFALATGTARTMDELIADFRGHRRTLEEVTQRYPDDPEAWYLLGDILHHGAALNGTAREAMEAFERAIALDSGFAPAYEHVVDLALQLGHPDRAAEYARAYPGVHASGVEASAFRLIRTLFDSGGIRGPPATRLMLDADVATLITVAKDHLSWWPDPAQTAVALLHEVVTTPRDVSTAVPPLADSVMWGQRLAAALAFRGRLREAVAAHGPLLADPTASRYSAQDDPFDDLALLGAIPDSLARRSYERALTADAEWGSHPLFLALPRRHLRGLPWWYSRGDTTAIAAFARRAATEARRGAPTTVLRARYYGAAAEAWLALARGDSAGAERLLGAISDTLCMSGGCYPEKLLLARLLAARGADREAAEVLDRWSRVGGARPAAVLATLDRGRIAERLGDAATARENYRFVVDVWRRADPELRTYVADARAGLARVGD